MGVAPSSVGLKLTQFEGTTNTKLGTRLWKGAMQAKGPEASASLSLQQLCLYVFVSEQNTKHGSVHTPRGVGCHRSNLGRLHSGGGSISPDPWQTGHRERLSPAQKDGL